MTPRRRPSSGSVRADRLSQRTVREDLEASELEGLAVRAPHGLTGPGPFADPPAKGNSVAVDRGGKTEAVQADRDRPGDHVSEPQLRRLDLARGRWLSIWACRPSSSTMP